MIIKLIVYSELIMLKAFVDKLNVSDSDGSKSDDSKGSDSECNVSASEGSDSDHGAYDFGDNSDSKDLALKSLSSGPYSILIPDLSCQH